MKKKPVIVTIVIVAAAAILIGGGIYLYPHLVERTVSQIVKNDMNNILEINLINWDNAKRSAQVTDKEEIDDIVYATISCSLPPRIPAPEKRFLTGSSTRRPGPSILKRSLRRKAARRCRNTMHRSLTCLK